MRPPSLRHHRGTDPRVRCVVLASRLLPRLIITTAVLFCAAPAAAFCRSTTCSGDCPRDDAGCKTTGHKLAWPGLCVGFSLQKDGTRNLPMDQVRPVIEQGFANWSDRACGSGMASIAFAELADVSCHEAGYDSSGPNANIIIFQDDKWIYHGVDDTLAKTTVSFDVDTGTILSADIEVNFAYNEFTVGDGRVVYDLQSVITHEIGHFLGLDHSIEPDATMTAGYTLGSTNLRSLEADDVGGLCAIYPPGRPGKCDPTPMNGLADTCDTTPPDSGGGCAWTSAPRSTGAALILFVSIFFLHLRRARGSRS